MRQSPAFEFRTAALADPYSSNHVTLLRVADPDLIPRPRLIVETPAAVAAKPQTAATPPTKAAASNTKPGAASGQGTQTTTPPATVSPLLVGGLALGFFGLYFLSK